MRYFWWSCTMVVCILIAFSPILFLGISNSTLEIICFIVFFLLLIPAKKILTKILDEEND
jgi:hypothetical protein